MSLQPFKPNRAAQSPQVTKTFIPKKTYKQPQCGTLNVSDLGSTVSGTGPGGIPNEYTVSLNAFPLEGHVPLAYSVEWQVWEFTGSSPLVSGSESHTGDGVVPINFDVPPGAFHFYATMTAAGFLDGPTFQIDITIP